MLIRDILTKFQVYVILNKQRRQKILHERGKQQRKFQNSNWNFTQTCKAYSCYTDSELEKGNLLKFTIPLVKFLRVIDRFKKGPSKIHGITKTW